MQMCRLAVTLGALLLAASLAYAQSDVAPPKPKPPERFTPPAVARPGQLFPEEQIIRVDSLGALVAGTYATSADPRGFVMINEWSGGVVSILSTRNWESIGYLNEGQYAGILRKTEGIQKPVANAPMGTLRFEVLPEGAVRARLRPGGPGSVEMEEVWTRTAEASDLADSLVALDPTLPAYGDYVYVEQLPEAVIKEPPLYPEKARRDRTEGTVVVQALVTKSGSVAKTLITKSIPALDAAAVQSVAKWKFKPAMSKGAPVAVWVAVPVRFSLK